MANAQVDGANSVGITVIDKRKSTAANRVVATQMLATPLNYSSISALRTRLAAANGALFTAARLDAMTLNDMIYALRTIDDAAGI